MERKFLEDLGIDKEIINQIMAEYGKNIQDLQKKISDFQEENQQLKNDNSTYQETIEKFKDIKPDEMQQTINDLKNQIQENENKYKQDLADRDFNSFIDNGLNESKARDVRAVKALLDIDSLKNSKNQNEDFKKAIEDLYKNDSLIEKMSKNCIAKRDNMISLEQYCDKLLKIYNEVIEGAKE